MKKYLNFSICCLMACFGMLANEQDDAKSALSESLLVWIEDFVMTADGETVGYIRIHEKDNIDYTAFQMRINVPPGLTIQKITIGRNTYDAIPSERFTASHSVTCNQVDDGQTIKIAVISSSNDTFFSDDEEGNPLDELCAIAITADNEMLNGQYKITMDDVKFIVPSSFAYIPEQTLTAIMTITGGQEAITGIQEDATTDKYAIYYDLSGRAIKNPESGVYIQDHRKILIK